MPGATLVTRLKVYDTQTPDGQIGGTPHFHFLCTEMYFVTAGSGAVELIDNSGFSRVELATNSALVFSPGTIHRLINPNKDMELLVIMQNSGLPERGDNVVCFEPEFMRSQETYNAAMKVSSFEDAYARRDKGVAGFLELKAAFEEGLEAGRERLEQFYTLANERTSGLRSQWRETVEKGAHAEAQTSLDHLKSLNENKLDHLKQAQQFTIHASSYKTPGFCGALNRYFDPATLELEGVVKGE